MALYANDRAWHGRCSPEAMDSDTKNVLFGLIDHRLPLGVLGLDRTGRVVTQNHAAQSMLGRGDGLFLRRGHLVAARAAESTGLHRLVLDACRRNGDGLRAGGALEVSRMSSSRPFGVLVAPLQAGGLPAAVAFITDPDNQAQTWRELLHRLYGLTAGETEVALLALGGKSITEVAELRGVTHNTVRTHLKQVFSKTGARSQADLVRLLLSGPPGEPARPRPPATLQEGARPSASRV